MPQEPRRPENVEAGIRNVLQPCLGINRLLRYQPFAILVTDESPGQKDSRQCTRAVSRIRNAGMMQAEHGIADGFAPLRRLGQSDTPAAIDAILGAIVALPHMPGRTVDTKSSDRARDVAHVIPPHQPTRIADAVRVHVARCQQKARRLQGSGRQNEPGRDNAKPIAVERLYCCLLDAGPSPPTREGACSSREAKPAHSALSRVDPDNACQSRLDS